MSTTRVAHCLHNTIGQQRQQAQHDKELQLSSPIAVSFIRKALKERYSLIMLGQYTIDVAIDQLLKPARGGGETRPIRGGNQAPRAHTDHNRRNRGVGNDEILQSTLSILAIGIAHAFTKNHVDRGADSTQTGRGNDIAAILGMRIVIRPRRLRRGHDPVVAASEIERQPARRREFGQLDVDLEHSRWWKIRDRWARERNVQHQGRDRQKHGSPSQRQAAETA